MPLLEADCIHQEYTPFCKAFTLQGGKHIVIKLLHFEESIPKGMSMFNVIVVKRNKNPFSICSVKETG